MSVSTTSGPAFRSKLRLDHVPPLLSAATTASVIPIKSGGRMYVEELTVGWPPNCDGKGTGPPETSIKEPEKGTDDGRYPVDPPNTGNGLYAPNAARSPGGGYTTAGEVESVGPPRKISPLKGLIAVAAAEPTFKKELAAAAAAAGGTEYPGSGTLPGAKAGIEETPANGFPVGVNHGEKFIASPPPILKPDIGTGISALPASFLAGKD